MAYDESTFRRRDTDGSDPVGFGSHDDSRFAGDASFREDADLRTANTAFASGGYAATEAREPDTDISGRRAAPAALDDVFDDPSHGQPGRDRMIVHIVLEVVLLLGAAALAFLLYRWDQNAVRGARLDALLVSTAALGLLTVAAGLTLRTAAPNLAVGPVAVGAGLFFARNGDHGVVNAGGIAVAAAVALGALVAVLVVGFQVPGWAASLATAFAVIVWISGFTGPQRVRGNFEPTEYAVYLFGGVAALAVVGGLIGTVKTVRRAVGRFRPVGDPAERRGGLAGAITAGSLVLSMVFAAVAGVLLAANAPGTAGVLPNPGLDLTGLALGAALLGGTSAYGRRGGIFGTLLASAALSLFITYQGERNWRIASLAIAAVVLVGGLVVTRLVETFGRPLSPREDEEEWSAEAAEEGAAWSPRQDSWSSPLPAQPAASRSDPWESDRWSGGR